MVRAIQSSLLVTLLLVVLLMSPQHAQSQPRPEPKDRAFGNAFSKPQQKTSKQDATTTHRSQPAETGSVNTEPRFDNPQSMMDHLRNVTSAASSADHRAPGVHDQQQFIRRATGGAVASESVDPKAKIVDSLQPEWVTGDQPLFGRSAVKKEALQRVPVTVSAFIPTTPVSRFRSTLDQIAALRREHNVRFGNVILVGPTENLALVGYDLTEIPAENIREQARANPKAPDLELSDIRKAMEGLTPPEAKALHAAGLKRPAELRDSEVLKRYGITVLPAWIIESSGVFHVFEGEYNPTEFFDPDGNFIAERW